tara:strand:- start:946 stop:2295 length:1350 start_codon:yes stop_codon:yes gene_type:complete
MKLKYALVSLACLFTVNAVAVERSKNVRNNSFNLSIVKASSSVVSLYASKNVANLADNVDAAIYGSTVKLKKENSLGSGVIVNEKGLIITNSHIVKDSQNIKVVTSDNKSYYASVVDIDVDLDLAILKVENTKDKFSPIKFADSDAVMVGDVVFAIGNPFGIGQSASMGIVSAIGRAFNMEHAEYLIQTDAAINPGNSGGALIDVDGKLIGLNSAIFSKTEAFSGVGFAVPANALRFALDTLETNGSIQRAWLGAKGQDVDQRLASGLGLKAVKGVYINQVIPNSPAAKADLKIGDVLTKIGNQEVTNNKILNAILKTAKVGERIYLQVMRNRRMVELEVTLKPIERRLESDKFIIRGNNILTGLVVERLSPELSHMLNLSLDSKGVAIIDRPQHLANNNIQVGDVILQINKTKITKISDLKDILNSPAPYGLKITLLRANREIKIFIK